MFIHKSTCGSVYQRVLSRGVWKITDYYYRMVKFKLWETWEFRDDICGILGFFSCLQSKWRILRWDDNFSTIVILWDVNCNLSRIRNSQTGKHQSKICRWQSQRIISKRCHLNGCFNENYFLRKEMIPRWLIYNITFLKDQIWPELGLNERTKFKKTPIVAS